MGDKVYKKIDIVGCSAKGIEDAIELALARAAETVHGLGWFEVKELRGAIRDGKPSEWQVTLTAGFKVD